MKMKLIYVLFCLVFSCQIVKAQQFYIKPLQYKIALEIADLSTNDPGGIQFFYQNSGIGVARASNPTYYNGITYDTAYITQGNFAPTSLRRDSYHNWDEEVYDEYGCGNQPDPNCHWTVNHTDPFENIGITLHYPIQDTTVGSVRVKMLPVVDEGSYNIPTHDLIKIAIDAPFVALNSITWQYSLGTSSVWNNLPNSINSNSLDVSAFIIFGNDYLNHLGQTVNIRASYSIAGGASTNTFITPFTVRLSSPHITQITPINVGCYGESNGAIKIKFDRTLAPNEKLNIFLKDTATQADYSALNLVPSNFTTTMDSVYTWEWVYSPYLGMYIYLNQMHIVAIPTYQWTTELPASGFHASLIGKYNSINTYSGGVNHFKYVQIAEPPIQNFYLSVQDNVVCKGGNTGSINVGALGGVGNYKYGIRHQNDSVFTWKNFLSAGLGVQANLKTENVRFLKAGRYYFKIRDANNCILRDTTGNEVIKYKDITEPAEELKVELLDVTEISAYDSINGAIRIKVKGGSRRIGEPIGAPVLPYYHWWRDSATNAILPNYTLDTLGGKYETKVQNLQAGTYYFEATDRNYLPDTNYNYQGCRIFLKVVLKRPKPLLVDIIKQQPVRCNGSTDAILRAAATGGVIDSLGYRYKWFKSVAGTFVQQASTDSLLSNIGIGIYKVEVLDKNNNFKASTTYTLTEPTQLVANATTTQSSCYSNADGTATGTAAGGTLPYRYQWSNSDLNPLMDSVPGGTYYLLVTDSLGCEATTQVSISSPIDMQTNITVVPIKCNNEANGTITVAPTGGTAPYQYTWSTGATNINNIQNLATGKYWLRTKDNNNCTKIDTIDVVNPQRYSVTAGPDRVVCPSQTIPLTATVLTDSGAVAPTLTYQWLGPVGFTTSILKTVNTLKPGPYYLSATNTSGCIQKDTVVVTYNATSAVPEFIVSTQAYVGENILLANLSNPVPDSVKWIVPLNATIISQSKNFCELKFADTGRFNVAINNYYPSGCVYVKNKNINVTSNNTFSNLGNQANAYLKLFRVYPNPTAGAFNVELVFNGITKARIRMVNTLTNYTVFDEVKEGQYSYNIPYNVTGITSTTYIIIIETAKGNFIFKLIKA
jgi:SprB repeat